jgi:hypothetical protein
LWGRGALRSVILTNMWSGGDPHLYYSCGSRNDVG